MYKLLKYLIFTLILSSFSYIDSAYSETINASSCSQSAVQSAVDIADDGDTVIVPAGNCTWTSTVTIPNTKGIILQGSGIDLTTIADGTGDSSDVLVLNVANGNSLTMVTGFTFDAKGVSKSGIRGQISINGLGLNVFRVNNCKITNLYSRGIKVWAGGKELSGLIDHVTIEAPYNVSTQGVSIFGAGSESSEPFSRPIELGSNKFIFIEDSTFNFSYPSDGCLDAYGGARYVFRHNVVNGTTLGHHGADSGNYRGVHSFEIYDNTFTNTGNSTRKIFFRSGTGVVFNNEWIGNYGGAELHNYRSCASYGMWGQCDGSTSYDGNQSGQQGYACLDQVGHVFTDSLDGSNILAPLFTWNNVDGIGNFVKFTVVNACSRLTNYHIIENRDFYNNVVKPDYSAYTYPHPLTTGTLPPPPATEPPPLTTEATYYVDNSGSPACSDQASYGSEAQPWCTVGFALSQISGGDDILIKTGVYNETFTLSNLTASSNDHTVIKNYSTDAVEIRGNGVHTGRLKFDNVDYVDFIGIEVTTMNQGIHIENGSTYVTIDNCEVHNVGQEAIHIKGNSHHITVQNSRIYDTRKWNYNGEGVYIGTGSTGPVDTTHDVTVYNNIIYNTIDEAVELKAGTYNCVVDGNTIYNITTGPSYGAIEVNEHIIGVQEAPQEPAHIIKNNIIHDVDTAIRAGTSCSVYNNVIYNVGSGDYGILVNNNAGDSWTRRIHENTITVPDSSNAIFISSGTTDLKNNVINSLNPPQNLRILE